MDQTQNQFKTTGGLTSKFSTTQQQSSDKIFDTSHLVTPTYQLKLKKNNNIMQSSTSTQPNINNVGTSTDFSAQKFIQKMSPLHHSQKKTSSNSVTNFPINPLESSYNQLNQKINQQQSANNKNSKSEKVSYLEENKQKNEQSKKQQQQQNNFIFTCFDRPKEEIESVEFIVKDKDTNQVYDIREIDKIDKFSQVNKKEYFDKLKKRHNAIWQDWWNSKKENNLKLLKSVKLNNMSEVQNLLDSRLRDLRAEVNVKDENGWAPLHYAAQSGNCDMVLLLLKNDASIDCLNIQSQTPLIIAAKQGYVQVVQIFLQAGADINHQDLNFNTALHYSSQYDKYEVVDVLLSRPSIDTTMKNYERKTAYDLSSKSSRIQKLFENYIAGQSKTFLNTNKVQIFDVSNDSVANLFQQEKPQKNYYYQQQQQQQQIQQQHAINGFNNYVNSSGASQVNNSSGGFGQNNSNSNNQNNNCNNNTFIIGSVQVNEQQPNVGYLQNIIHKKIGLDNFQIIEMIGRGSFGEVFIVEEQATCKKFAMKVLNKSRVFGQNLVRYALTERNVLSIASHPYIVKLKYAFQNNQELFLIMDYCPGGDLQKLLQQEQAVNEYRAKIYIAEILTALEHLHQHDIIYRDLKPENIVFDEDGHAMLTDFGLSKEGVSDNDSAQSFCGSLAYLAPEMVKRIGHGKAVDWYHLGVLLFEMLSGQPPFISNDRDDLLHKIEHCNIQFPTNISNDAKDLISKLLVKNPLQRLGSSIKDAQDIKQHNFFRGIDWNQLMNRKILPPKSKNQLQQQQQQQSYQYEYRYQIPKSLQFYANTSRSNKTLPAQQCKNYIGGWSFINNEDY